MYAFEPYGVGVRPRGRTTRPLVFARAHESQPVCAVRTRATRGALPLKPCVSFVRGTYEHAAGDGVYVEHGLVRRMFAPNTLFAELVPLSVQRPVIRYNNLSSVSNFCDQPFGQHIALGQHLHRVHCPDVSHAFIYHSRRVCAQIRAATCRRLVGCVRRRRSCLR